jgi:hypothetical protein
VCLLNVMNEAVRLHVELDTLAALEQQGQNRCQRRTVKARGLQEGTGRRVSGGDEIGAGAESGC